MGFRPRVAQKQPIERRRGPMKPDARQQIGHGGHAWANPWARPNPLKLKAGHAGHAGHGKKSTSINVFQTPVGKRSRDRETPPCPACPPCPNNSLNIYYIIILNIYIYSPFGVRNCFPSFGHGVTAFGHGKSQVGHGSKSNLPLFKAHYRNIGTFIFCRIGGQHGAV